MHTKFIIKGLTREGRLVPVPVREDYDYEDRYPFEHGEYDDHDEAVQAIRVRRNDLRLNRDNIKHVLVLPVVETD